MRRTDSGAGCGFHPDARTLSLPVPNHGFNDVSGSTGLDLVYLGVLTVMPGQQFYNLLLPYLPS